MFDVSCHTLRLNDVQALSSVLGMDPEEPGALEVAAFKQREEPAPEVQRERFPNPNPTPGAHSLTSEVFIQDITTASPLTNPAMQPRSFKMSHW